MNNPLKRIASVFGVVAVCAMLAGGQVSSTGSLAGSVTDQAGAVVAGASVVVKNNATGAETTVTTADNGTFNVPSLTAGTYTVNITAQGFKQSNVRDVKIDVGSPSSINVAMEVGAVTESVTITGAGGELLQTQTATVGTTITGRQITDIPFTSRDALDLVTLMPGVQTPGRPRTASVNGLPKGALNITIDGVNVQDNLIKSQDGFFTYVRPRIDSIDEVSVSSATPGAESAGEGAVQIKFITRGGTNDLRGSLYWYHRNPALNANYWFNNRDLAPDPRTGKAPRNRVLLNQPGVRVGGPVVIPGLFDGRDKAFFFVNYEEFRLPEQQLRARTIFTPSIFNAASPESAGNFTYFNTSGAPVTVNLFQLASAAGFNGASNTLDPTVSSLMSQIRQSTTRGTVRNITQAGGQVDPNYQQFSFINSGGQIRRFPTVRLDYNITDRHHLENIYNYQRFNSSVDFLNFTDPSYPFSTDTGGQYSHRYSNSTALRSTLSTKMVNELRFGLSGGNSQFLPEITPSAFAQQGGFDLNLSNAGISDVTAINPAFLGANRPFGVFGNNGTSPRNTPIYNLTDTLTYTRGNHSFNFGGSYTYINAWSTGPTQTVSYVAFGLDRGEVSPGGTNIINAFNSTALPGSSAADRATAQSIYALLTGRVTTVAGIAQADQTGRYVLNGFNENRISQKEWGIFGQDSWRVRPNLTVNAGLRYQVEYAPESKNEFGLSITPYEDIFGISGVGNLFRPGTLTGRETRSLAFAPGVKLYNTDYNNFAPTFGVAWNPSWKSGLLGRVFGGNGQSVLRGGYSIAYVRESLSATTQALANNPGPALGLTRSVLNGNLTPGALFRDRSNVAVQGFPERVVYPFVSETSAGGDVFNDAAFAVNPNLKLGYVQSWTAGFQREINKDTVFEARYVGTRGIKLWRRYGLNEVNVIENGFFNEFQLALANLNANNAAGGSRRGSFAYFGEGTGTSPLPVTLAYTTGIPVTDAAAQRDPSNYASAIFTFPALVNNLAPASPNALNFAGNLYFLFNDPSVNTGLPANYFVANPSRQGGPSLLDNGGHTWYDGLTLEVRRRLAQGLLVQTSYTFSKSETDMFANSQSVLNSYVTLRNPGLNKTLSPFDIRHQFKVNWIYELPLGRGRAMFAGANGLVNHLVGGWEWHGAARVQSGAPFN
ncbi:MAG TPA: TonB-dependent receptor, partial [Pyrinomonadaceae bacterium]|nr:TonB-dependent receptor [Pyrinomonadaceae bacterium]